MLLFLFFGSRNVRRTLEEGEFHCPRCRAVRRYELVHAQPHGHVYFIPLFKLGQGQEYVRCQSCRTRFHPNVLRGDTDAAAAHASVASACAAALCSVVLADGNASEAEVSAVARELSGIGGARVDAEDVRPLLRQPGAGEVGQAESMLARVARSLRAEEREEIARAMLRTSAADGDPSPAAAAVVRRLASVLEITPTHLRGIVAELAG